ncbi:hypothetical protein OIU35_31585 [Boseaceae bacterium BT-24-1]|nr:hypothetical protein [Boseaceae bacterium BT-24-1]
MSNDDLLQGGEGEPAPAMPSRARAPAQVRASNRSDPRQEPVPGERLVRQRTQHSDKFHIDPRKIPSGMTYEYKRISCLGQADPFYEQDLAANHWSPVPASRHPELMAGSTEGTIVREGLQLMERPAYLTEEARAEDDMAARQRVNDQQRLMAETPEGTLSRAADPRVRPSIRTHREAMPIPND